MRPEEENSECLLYGFRGTSPSKLENDDKEDGGREEKRGEERRRGERKGREGRREREKGRGKIHRHICAGKDSIHIIKIF